jgi:hypothetical protein
VYVLVRRRPGWHHFTDGARAVELAGKPRGWLPVAERVVREVGLNVNRRGVISVSSPDWRPQEWIDWLQERVADTSLAVYEALLELDM